MSTEPSSSAPFPYVSGLDVVIPPEPSQIAPHPAARCEEKKKKKTTTRVRRNPFCNCFSRTISDVSDDEDPSESPKRRIRRRKKVDVPPEPRPWSLSMLSELLRMRLTVVAETPRQPRTSETSVNNPPVHRIVEYSRHLVCDIDRVYASSYYWGVMDRFQAEELLDGKEEGTFLLRDSAQEDYLFSVSFRRYQRTLHARIEQANHRFGFDILDATVFSSNAVTQLIENYKDPARCLFFEPQLTHPLHRKNVFSLFELSRAKVLSRTTYSNIGRLPLPAVLQDSLRQYNYTVPVRVHDVAH